MRVQPYATDKASNAKGSDAPGTSRIVLFETSALLATLSLFTDHYTHDPEALERLIEPVSPGMPPLLDKVLIPDHVIYELTGILPISFPFMQQRFAELKDDPKKLHELIDMYALASPRGEVNDPAGDQKSHVRMLLRFIANHPDCIVHTETGKAYCERLKADYSVLGAVSGDTIEQHRPTFADAFHYLGDAFSVDALRVHAGQLMMFGLINEREFNDRIGRVETVMSKQQRFYKTEEIVGKLSKNGMIPEELAEQIKRHDTHVPDDEKNGYFKLGLLREFPELLRLPARHLQHPTPPGVRETVLSDDELFRAALAPSPLLMEHYLYSGIIPNTNASLLVMANALGFDTKELRSDDDSDHIRQALYVQGFYELSPTLAQLRRVEAACTQAHIACEELATLTASLPRSVKGMQQRFRDACHNPQENGLAQQKELRIPHIGMAYEKVFSDALVNGALTWDEFQQLVLATGGLHRRYDSYIGSQSADMLLLPSPDAAKAHIYIALDGFVGRTGKTIPQTYISRSTRSLSVGNEQRIYYDIPASDLIERCRTGLIDRRVSSKLHRSFETMLYRPAAQDAVQLRTEAVKILGEDRVVQVEKNFANRHARKSLQVQPPYQSLFSALHTNSRILRKNLGEVATLEAAKILHEQNPQANIWVTNHDSDLFCDSKRDLQIEDSVVRQHAGMHREVRGLNAALQGKEQVHLVNTVQFLDTLHTIMGRTPQKTYDVVSAKTLILKHQSRSWANDIDRRAQSALQR